MSSDATSAQTTAQTTGPSLSKEDQEAAGGESLRRVAVASFIGTAIEFYDFYIYGTAAALVLNQAFFPTLNPVNATLASFSTYAVAFAARPLGSVIFGHFGDRVGRKSVLVASLLLMGLSTACVGLLPGYGTWGVWAPLLLIALRFLQGIGLGGEWGGAALLAVEHAPRKRRGLYAAFPQLGPSVGFFAATGVFWLLSSVLDDAAFRSWGWRVPFLLSFLLVGVGLFVRLKISETPVFAKVLDAQEAEQGAHRRCAAPASARTAAGRGRDDRRVWPLLHRDDLLPLLRHRHPRHLPQHHAGALPGRLPLPGGRYLARRHPLRRRRTPQADPCRERLAVVWGLVLFPLLDTGQPVLIAVGIGGALFCMGVVYGPMGAYLPELFSATVRYSGASLAYNLGGVLGGAVAPLVATRLQSAYGSASVGWYVSAMAVVSLLCVLALPETRERELV